MKKNALIVAAGLAVGLSGVLGTGVANGQAFTTQLVASGFARPLYVTAPPGDINRIFVLEQRGTGGVGTNGGIRIVNIPQNTVVPTPYLTILGVTTGSEQGVLGLAFHPRFAQNGYFFVNYTNSSGTTVIARYRVAGDPLTTNTVSPATQQIVLTIAQPFSNHNGGWIGFRPDDTDGLLYIATGDGGSGNDPNNAGQNNNQLLGKMLRIDIDGPDNVPGNADDDGFPGDANRLYTNPSTNPFFGATAGEDEIFMTGLRNHWRNAFDRANNDLYVADVGQNAFEEISWVRGDRPITPIVNFGWRCMEGLQCTGLTGCTCNAPALTMPVWTYGRSFGCSITGGEVYRGLEVPALNGSYFFADFCTNTIWSFSYDRSGNAVPSVVNRTTQFDPPGTPSIASITSFGLDALGELYIVDQSGEIFRLIRNDGTRGRDCNANGIDDVDDILRGTALDCNGNWIPDSCSTDPSPRINTQPSGISICAGSGISLNVGATTAAGTITYQWRRNGTNISGATNSILSINPATVGDAGSYDVIVTSGCRSVTSNAVNVTVTGAPVITTDPQSQNGCRDGSAVLTFASTGAASQSWQYRTFSGAWTTVVAGNNPPVSPFFSASGETTTSITLSNLSAASEGTLELRAVAANTCGSTESLGATVRVCLADFNCDGNQDFFDYLDFVAAFDAELPSSDVNGDNTVDFFDYLDFVAAFDGEC
jgi:glucose/arabinose dehydrogenase